MRLWAGIASKLQFVLRVVVAFAIARVAAGVIIIVFFSRDAVAWSYQLTALFAGALALCFVAAYAVRRWAPPRAR